MAENSKKKQIAKKTSKKTKGVKKAVKKTTAVKKTQKSSVAKKKKVVVKKAAVVKKVAVVKKKATATKKKSPAPAVAQQELSEKLTGIQEALHSLRSLLEKPEPQPIRIESHDVALESSVDSLRRLLSELLENQMEPVINDLVAIRAAAMTHSPDHREAVLERLDRLLKRLGAVSFEAEVLDHLDPLIHTPISEKSETEAPDNVILETVAPGFRTGKGTVVARAAVVVNRRS